MIRTTSIHSHGDSFLRQALEKGHNQHLRCPLDSIAARCRGENHLKLFPSTRQTMVNAALTASPENAQTP